MGKEEEDDFVSKLPDAPSNLGDDLKTQHDAADVASKDMLKEKAVGAVERYCFLILFNMYVKEQQALGEEGFQTTFAQFAQADGKKELFGSLDGLSCFYWN